MKFNPKYNLNLYGTHGRDDILNEMTVNHLTSTIDRIKFKGKVKNDEKFFKENYIYSNLSTYDSFDYYTFFSFLNGSVPLISETSSSSLFFKSYPFIVNNKVDSMSNMLDVIDKTSVDDIKDILKTLFEDIKELNNENNYEQYKKFLDSL
jgi:ERCC4-type nuclease